jgi:hypothetical protein
MFIISHDVVYLAANNYLFKLNVLRGSEEIIDRPGDGGFAFGGRTAWILV